MDDLALNQLRSDRRERSNDQRAGTEDEARSALEQRLKAYAGKPVGVIVRRDDELVELLARNPFPDEPGSRTVALFTDEPLSAAALAAATGVADERMSLGPRAIYIAYGSGMANSRLRVPAAGAGTARNMNTVAKLAEMVGALI